MPPKTLEGPLPHKDFPRKKTEKKVGIAVERLTPMPPPTVAALKAHRQVQPLDGYVFRTAQGAHFSSRKTDPADEAEKQRAEVKWHTYEMRQTTIPVYAPALSLDRARKELEDLGLHALNSSSPSE